MKLTDLKVKNLKPKPERYELWEGNSFGIRVFPTGVKSWVLMYRSDRRLRFGRTESKGRPPILVAHRVTRLTQSVRSPLSGVLDKTCLERPRKIQIFERERRTSRI